MNKNYLDINLKLNRKNILEYLKKIDWIIVISIVVLALLKQFLVYNFPIFALTKAKEDDALMVDWAYSIADGKYLGDYYYNTLMKGPVFSKILSLLYLNNIQYISFVTFFYTFSCILFVIAIKKLIKNRYVLIGFYILLLFNPIMFSSIVLQRVYRNALIPSFALIITGSYLAIYLNRNEKIIKIIPWVIIESISLSLFYYTREDSMWIIPFIIFISIVTIFSIIMKDKKINLKLFYITLCLIFPMIVLNLFGSYIANLNYSIYGIKTKNILSDSKFTEALNAIYAVKPKTIIDSVTVTQEKTHRIAEISSSFNEILPYVTELIGGYGSLDRKPNDNEVEDGWFLWVIRGATYRAGYINPEMEEDIYGRIANEINFAFEEGKLEKQMTMPSPLLSPFRKTYILPMIRRLLDEAIYISTFKDLKIENDCINDTDINDSYLVYRFENITHNKAIYDTEANNLDGLLKEQLENQEDYINSLNIKKFIINNIIINIYKILGIILFIIGLISYVLLTVKMIIQVKDKKNNILEKWFISSGMLGSLFTLMFGIAYNDVATAYSIKVLYTCGTYSLFIATTILIIFFTFEELSLIKND